MIRVCGTLRFLPMIQHEGLRNLQDGQTSVRTHADEWHACMRARINDVILTTPVSS